MHWSAPARRAACAGALLLVSLVLLAPGTARAALTPAGLRCEWRVDPLGIDTPAPRLSWLLAGPGRGQRQTAYRIVVESEDGVAWDSGKVASGQTVNVPYAGRPLRARERLRWQVTVWDARGRSARSPAAFWEMGLLSEDDWGGARWIGRPIGAREQAPRRQPEAMRWIWYPEGDPIRLAPAGQRILRRRFALPDRPARRALLYVACDGRCSARLNGMGLGQSHGPSQLTQLDAGQAVRAGDNTLELHASNGGEAAGAIGQLVVELDDGEGFLLSTDESWQAARAEEPGHWVAARVVGKLGDGEYWQALAAGGVTLPTVAPPAYLRRSFTLARRPRRARLYATALGIYELSINGRRVGADHFAPGWTDYTKRVQYQSYDVTALLRAGDNALGALLGDGWWSGRLGWNGQRNNYGGYPLRLRLRLVVEYPDGRSESLISDEGWRALPDTRSPVRAADFFDGESCDGRLAAAIAGWDRPGFRDEDWAPVDAAAGATAAGLDPAARLVAEPGAAVRAHEEVRPVRMTEPAPGVFVFDFGQNLVGWTRLRVRGPAGTEVRLRHAEMLNPDGTLYTASLRSAESTDRYTLAGGRAGRPGSWETWEPRLTFHGFRYAELTGYPGRPTLAALTARVVHSDIPRTGTLVTSSPMLNQLLRNIDWGQRGNFLSVPTDCPQRDERLGWMGDAQIFARTACFNRDVAAFFTKWLRDVADAQSPEGGFPDFAPRVPGSKGGGAPAWGDAGVIVPWVLYECYGDERLLEEHYPRMVAWVRYIHARNPDLLWRHGRNADFGDWLSIDADTDKELIGTAFFAHSTRLVARAARALGRADDASEHEALFDRIRSAFARAYLEAEGKLRSDTQTAYALALRFGLLDAEAAARAAGHLDAAVARHGGHLSTGFVGVAHLLPALSGAGLWRTAYDLLLKDTFPSWGYSIRHGATTIWERWDGWTAERGFQTPNMNSFNHYSFGSVGEWLYAHVGGIAPLAPGYARILVAPRPGGGLTHAEARYRSAHGAITTRWSLRGDLLTLEVEVPANASALVRLPGVPVGPPPTGASPTSSPTTLSPGDDGPAAYFAVDSGRYRFRARVPGATPPGPRAPGL